MNNVITDDLSFSDEEMQEEQSLIDELNGVVQNPLEEGEEEEEQEQEEEFEEGDSPEEEQEEDGEEEEEDPEKETEKETKSKKQDFEPIKVTVNGQELELESVEETKNLISTLANRISKKEINNEKRMLEQAGLTKDDIELLADIKAGNKAAINELLKRQKVTLDDLDEVKDDYKKEFEYKEATELDQLVEEVTSDKEFHGKYIDTVNKMPKDFATAIHSDANAMRHFVRHVKTGLADKIIPLANKASLLHGTDFAEEYIKIGRELARKGSEKTEKKTGTKREVKEVERSKRGRRTQGRSSVKKDFSVDEINNMSEEEFTKHFGE